MRTSVCPPNSTTKKETATSGLSFGKGVSVMASLAEGMHGPLYQLTLALFRCIALCRKPTAPHNTALLTRLLHNLEKRAETHDCHPILIIHPAISQWNACRGCKGGWVDSRSPRRWENGFPKRDEGQ